MFLSGLTMVKVWRVFSARVTGEHATFHSWGFQSRDDPPARENRRYEPEVKASYRVKVPTPTVQIGDTMSVAISAQRLGEGVAGKGKFPNCHVGG